MTTYFIKFLIAILGLSLTLTYILAGLIKRNRANFKVAGTVFLSMIAVIISITATELYLHDKSKDYLEKETLLVAMREASFGGIHLRVYADSTFDLGNENYVTERGTIKIKRDTLLPLQNDSITRAFVLDKTVLREIKNNRINFLEIETNKLMIAD